MSIEIGNESGTPVDEIALLDVARATLERLRIHPLAELSILLVDLPTMEQLHVQWMDEPGPTDVLSFPMDELRVPGQNEEPPEGLLGDIVLCPEFAQKQGATNSKTMDEELHMLCVHGILHLLGYDHAEPDEEREMFGLQGSLLTQWQAERSPGGAPS
jgi:probable rRNA maturation factor